jgi:hypothetical protein
MEVGLRRMDHDGLGERHDLPRRIAFSPERGVADPGEVGNECAADLLVVAAIDADDGRGPRLAVGVTRFRQRSRPTVRQRRATWPAPPTR